MFTGVRCGPRATSVERVHRTVRRMVARTSHYRRHLRSVHRLAVPVPRNKVLFVAGIRAHGSPSFSNRQILTNTCRSYFRRPTSRLFKRKSFFRPESARASRQAQHIMISYEHGSSDMVKKIVDRLQKSKLKVSRHSCGVGVA